MVVGIVEAGQIYFVRTDHIGWPIFSTDAEGTKVWEASYLPFGGVHVSIGANSTLRFPGQWFQTETWLHQNWMRDYDPTLGRYLQADPLGLVDGANVYGYALQNPGRYTDLRGEQSTRGLGGSGGTNIIWPGSDANQTWSNDASRRLDRLLDDFRSNMEGGRADGPSPVSHAQEHEAMAFMPDPFGSGNAYCQNLRYLINVLRQGIAWRRTDLNWMSSSYKGHKARIALMLAKLRMLEQHYENVCGGECPVDF